MSERRVAITGLGIISSIGQDIRTYWDALRQGRSGIGPITRFDASRHTSRIAGEVKDFDPTAWMDKRLVRRLDRFAQFAVAAATQAVEDAGLELDREDLTRIGVVVGTGIGGLEEIETQHKKLIERGPDRLSPFLVPKLMGNAASGQVAICFGLQGPNVCCISACASATHSLLEAFHMIRRGEADVIISGGSEAAVTPLGVGGFCALKALSTRNDEPERASRPFDRERDGFVVGEGAGIVVLEEWERARKRGADIHAVFAGGGMSCDGFHITQPDPSGKGAANSMSSALKQTGLRPEDVGYINAHGTSTPYNDVMETKAVKLTFGEHAYKVPISSTKSMIGHLLGGSGGAEIVATALCLKHDTIHPTANYEVPDPECDLDYVPGEAREARLNAVLSNSFGFGGHNATVVLVKPQ